MRDPALAAWVRLTLTPGLGGQTLRRLLAEFGLPENVLAAPRSALTRVAGEAIAARLLSDDHADAVAGTLDWADKPGRAILTLADDAFPRPLLETPDPPAVLFAAGRLELLARPALAVVGSRNATPQGIANAESFARALAQAGLTILSGLALGIDAAAHRGGLAGPGSTIAVLGTGIDAVYPARNRSLFEQIATEGLLLSEFPLGTPPSAGNFPRRNRLISGLSRGVLVVEAAVASGSLITARIAAEQGREVFAIPGSIHSPLAKGCHALIKQGAKLVDSAQDVLEELGISATTRAAEIRSDSTESALLRQLGHDPCDVDTLAARCGLTPAEVSSILLTLELEGKVASLPGGRYQRLT